MEMTYSEPQTPLFPSYVNLVQAKDHWKIGESEHNTDCDVIVTPPTFAYTRPCSMPAASWTCTAEWYCEETREDNREKLDCVLWCDMVEKKP